jgi:hypothetical protein
MAYPAMSRRHCLNTKTGCARPSGPKGHTSGEFNTTTCNPFNYIRRLISWMVGAMMIGNGLSRRALWLDADRIIERTLGFAGELKHEWLGCLSGTAYQDQIPDTLVPVYSARSKAMSHPMMLPRLLYAVAPLYSPPCSSLCCLYLRLHTRGGADYQGHPSGRIDMHEVYATCGIPLVLLIKTQSTIARTRLCQALCLHDKRSIEHHTPCRQR